MTPALRSDDSAKSENGNFDKLIQVLDAGFAQLEAQRKERKEQSDRLILAVNAGFTRMSEQHKEQADGLRMAIEAKTQVKVNETANINTQPAGTDIKTKFWTLYKKLADEQDKEFVDKYSADLENSLIFAGLFSAVTSAFIIQIQPEIQSGVSHRVLAAQGLLYFSLGMTLLASLLTVLGKQWILHYSAAGEKGTIDARGRERQSKLDGLRKWKFDAVMQTFPLLLQAALLLFAAALTIYLWKIHLALAGITLSLTATGFTAYIVLLASAAVSPDSPFQTPLTPLVTWLISTRYWKESSQFLQRVTQQLHQFIHDHPLPFFSSHSEAVSLFDTPQPSPEVPAVSWVLEVSTNPDLFDTAVEMVPELQWPGTMDLGQQVERLHQGFLACNAFFIELSSIRDGMTLRAISLGRAYCTLRERSRHLLDFSHRFEDSEIPELNNVLQILQGKTNLGLNSTAAFTTKWALHVIPSLCNGLDVPKLEHFLRQFKETVPNLDTSSFTDYLFCILSFLSTTHQRDMLVIDKSPFQRTIFEHFLKELTSAIRSERISMELATAVIETTGQLAGKSENSPWADNFNCSDRQSTTFQFCSGLPRSAGWLGVAFATGLLTGAYTAHPQRAAWYDNSNWVYDTLGTIKISEANPTNSKVVNGVSGLLNALLYYQAPAKTEHINLVLPVLSIPGDISKIAVCLLLQKYMNHWFEDTQLQRGYLWSPLTYVVLDLDDGDLAERYIQKGHQLASIPDWQPHIKRELTSWILIFFRGDVWNLAKEYTTVLSQFRDTATGRYQFRDDSEMVMGTSYAALNNVWKDFDFTTLKSLEEAVPWVYCLSSVLLRTEYDLWAERITIGFTVAFSGDIHESLIHAAQRARETILQVDLTERKEALNCIAGILEDIASKMPMTAADLEHEDDYWEALRMEFDEKIGTLKDSLQTMSASGEHHRSSSVILAHI